MIPMSWYLLFSAVLFCVGLFGVLARKNAIGVLMGIELMLNSTILNLLTFWSYLHAPRLNGLVFAAIVFATAAAETAVGLALIISAYRRRRTVVADEMDILNG